jgi:branched-chain amino acid transport system ATP-binding protein
MIECLKLCQSFGGLQVLTGLDLRVGKSEILGLIGPNGAGKSTLFNTLTGVHPARSGTIRIEGKEVRIQGPDHAARLGIARTFQTPRPLAGLSVLENVLVATADLDFAQECLHQAGIESSAERWAGELNLMDRKRLEVARALALRPKVLLLDEAMAGLTLSEMVEAIAWIRSLKTKGIAVIWVEHVMSALFQTCDRIAVLYQGSILREGTPAEISKDEMVRRIYLGEDS